MSPEKIRVYPQTELTHLPLRNICVCYDGWRQVSWVNREEFDEIKAKYDIQWWGERKKNEMVMHDVTP